MGKLLAGVIITATLTGLSVYEPARAQTFLQPVIENFQQFQSNFTNQKAKRSRSEKKRLKPGTEVAIPLPIRPAKKVYSPPPGFAASPAAPPQMATKNTPNDLESARSLKPLYESQPAGPTARDTQSAPIDLPAQAAVSTTNAVPLPAKRSTAKKSKPEKRQTPNQKVADLAAPEPDVWSQDEINIAKARCAHLLKQVDAITFARPPLKKGPCGDPNPLIVATIGSSPEVSINPPATMNCAMIAAVYKWLQNDLQPMARKMLGSPITAIKNMSSYSCRNRYGRKNGKLSEHARANALDIGAFVTQSGKTVSLLKGWGPTKRDLAKAIADAKRAREEALAAKKAVAEADKPLEITKTSATATPAEPDGHKLGGPTTSPAKQSSAAKLKIPKRSTTKEARFLHAAHTKACKTFGTVLGPEANDAHRNHFHVDLAYRRRSNYCQ